MKTKEIFKLGDRVFSIHYGWGKISEIIVEDEYPLTVIFDNGNFETFTSEGKFSTDNIVPLLSFIEYELKGFSQERPNPSIAVDTLLWVRDTPVWNQRYFSHFDKNGEVLCFEDQKKSIETQKLRSWVEYSLTNPLI